MIHRYYDYRRRLYWVAAFLIIFLQQHSSLKEIDENNLSPFVETVEPINSALPNENIVSLNVDARFIRIVNYIK